MNLGPKLITQFDHYCSANGTIFCVNLPTSLRNFMSSLPPDHLKEFYTIIRLKEDGSSIWWSSAHDWYHRLPELQKSIALEIYLKGGLKPTMDDVGGDEPDTPDSDDMDIVDLDDDTADTVELLESIWDSVSETL